MSENTTVIEETTTTQEETPTTQEEKADTQEKTITQDKPKEPEATTISDAPETETEIKISEKKPLFHFRKDNNTFSRDEWILQNLNSEDLMEYLRLEQHRMELLQEAKEVRGKRFLKAFELTVSLAAISLITYFLKDNPTILISTLYTLGIIIVFWLWRKPNGKNDEK